MSISTRVSSYLLQQGIQYQAIQHFHSDSSIGTAVTANVPLEQIAKAVLLTDHEGRKVMAVLPANRKVSLSAINEELHGSYRLVKEQELYKMFADCDSGAIPPVAQAYNMTLICEPILDELSQVYIEAGDHETLLRLEQNHYQSMVSGGKHIQFSKVVFH